ncbi:MAG: hypothetical protein IPK68_07620 [Bdellovibrionales bacterium]|nr:hypothetical protein [Bdellovibrionales bacterium]
MASLCPVCNGFLEEDFGLMSCPSCGASLFFEIDGSVRSYDEHSKEEIPPSLRQSESHIQPVDSEDISGGEGSIELVDKIAVVEFPLDENVDEGMLLEEKGPYHGPRGGGPGRGGVVMTVDDQEIEESQKGEELRLDQNFLDGDLSLNQGEVYSASANENTSVTRDGLVGADLSNMNELAAYGNSEESMGREGPLRVRVVVEGIDSPEIREDVKGALTDRKFLWDVEGLMRTINSGCLVIESLTPLKAAIFIERIKGLPLEVHWEQSAINKA